MKYTIEIRCDNAAFDEYPEQEINRILQDLINRQANGPIENRNLRDINGNTVGEVRVYHDRKDIPVRITCPECGHETETTKTPGSTLTYYCDICRAPIDV